MNKRLLAVSTGGMPMIGLGINVLPESRTIPDAQVGGNASRDGIRTLVYDLACDQRTFRLNKSGTLLDARRGDGFAVHGKIIQPVRSRLAEPSIIPDHSIPTRPVVLVFGSVVAPSTSI